MKGYAGAALVTALLLAGCDGKDKAHEGYYLVDKIHVEFDNSQTKPQDNLVFRDAQQREIAQKIKKQNSDNYFNFTPSMVTYYTPHKSRVKNIRNEHVQLDDIDYTIAQGKEHTLHLSSDNGMNCGFHTCRITMTLKKASGDSAKLIKRQLQQNQSEYDYQVQLQQSIAYFQHPVLDDFLGIPLSLGHDFAIKMPGDIRLIDRTPADCTRNCNLDAFPLASQANGEMSIFTYYSKSEAHGGTLYVFKGEAGELTVEKLLQKQTPVLLQTENGAIYYNEQGKLEAFYFYYDTANGHYLLGVANAATAEQIAREFTILRTMAPHYRGQKIISMADLQLSRQELEEKYQAKVSDVFDVAAVKKSIWQALDRMLIKPNRFYDPGGGMMLAPVWYSSSKSSQDIYVQLYAQSIDTLMEGNVIGLARTDKPKGKRAGNFLIYDGENFARYYFMIKVDEQLTLVLGAPEFGDEREKMFLSQVFKQLDLSTSPLAAVPAEEKKNLFKYGELSVQAGAHSNNRYFTADEGLLDNHGNLIIRQPENGDYAIFSERPPFILAPLRDKEHEDMGWSIFNEQGKPLLFTQYLRTEIVEQHLAIAGESRKQGIFDLNSQKWLLSPTYEYIDWRNSAFIATDANNKQSLIDREGRVLLSGAKYVYNTDSKNHFAVVSADGNVSLVNERGQAWFQHRGNALRYIAEINAWQITVPAATQEDERVGIISENGEMIIPATYYRCKIEGDYLQMRLPPEGGKVEYFDLNQVKDWKNHQPLQPVSR